MSDSVYDLEAIVERRIADFSPPATAPISPPKFATPSTCPENVTPLH